MPHKNLGPCTVIALDPGTTTGIVVVSLNPRWVRGQGSPSWETLGRAVEFFDAYQIGREPRILGSGRSRKVTDAQINERLLPVLAEGQPLVDDESLEFDGRGRRVESLYAILDGEPGTNYGRGDLTTVDAGELLQVHQISGLLDNWPRATLVIEDFILRPTVSTAREVLSPARIRLAVEAQEVLHGEGRLPFLQMPSYMSTVPNDRLKRANLYVPGMPHATDAARHAAAFFRRCRANESLRAQAFPRHCADWEV